MGKCVVIGLQSTGEARTLEAVEVTVRPLRYGGGSGHRARVHRGDQDPRGFLTLPACDNCLLVQPLKVFDHDIADEYAFLFNIMSTEILVLAVITEACIVRPVVENN